jgi:outer membrane protein assembly factor BamB
MARCPLPAVLLVLLAAGPGPAGEAPARAPLPGESAATGRRLDAADKLAAESKYAAAAEEYARILDEVGGDLVPVGDRLCVPARRLCNLRLAALPPDVLAPYRTRVDPQAKKWLDQGAADRDLRLLRRVVEEAFCSRHADAALDLLGDLAFERGDFHQAGRWWRTVARPASEVARRAGQPAAPPWAKADERAPAVDLLYPDPRIDVARARAKQVLALLFLGEHEAAAKELEAFRALHPAASGHLAGRDGNYANILQDVAARKVPAAPADDAWPTFAGDPSRGPVLPAEPGDPNRLLPLVSRGPAWRFRLDTGAALGPRPPPSRDRPAAAGLSAVEAARHLAFHPVIVGRQVLVADARGVTAFDATTGDRQRWPANEPAGPGPSTALPADLRYTLTAADGRIYARLGVQRLQAAKQGAEADSRLACLELAEPGHKLRAVWQRNADPPAKGPPPMFEGAPAVRDGLLYVAATRFESTSSQAITEVRCYAADSGALRWKQDAAATRDLPAGPRYRHHLLTLAGRHVVYASHGGAVVALDALTGRRAWAMRYPSTVLTTPAGNPVQRDLAPAVYADGRLFVAPGDYDRLLCLDPETGRVLWERERVGIIHLLGVGSGRVIFTTTRGIRAVRAADGDDAGGWQKPEYVGVSGLPSYGRGLLAGDLVFWPTRDGLKVLSQKDGEPPPDLIPGPLGLHNVRPGNLAYADGILAVANATTLSVYVRHGPPGKAPEEGPGGALGALSRLATTLAAAGRPAEAVAAWQRLLDDDTLRRGTLRDARRLPQSAAAVAADTIDELIRTHGPALYAPTEEKARALLASAQGDPAALERLTREYPNAAAVLPALRQLARSYEKSRHWGADADAYRRLLRRHPAEDERKAAQAGLARAVEQQRKCCAAAPAAALQAPLARCWEGEERLLALPDGSTAAEILLMRGTTLVCREAATGRERWAQPLVGRGPAWVGRAEDIAVVAGSDAVQGVALSDGTRLWELPAPDPATFTDPRLSGFHLAGGRFFCLQGECRLLALNVESGRVLWQHWAPAARLDADVPGCRLSPHYLATPDLVLLQFEGHCRVLDARTGSLRQELPTGDILWPQPPLPLGPDRVALVNDRQAVVALDLSSPGKPAWSYAPPFRSTLTGEPPLLAGDRDALLIVVPRNYGYTVQRLDAATGRPLWSRDHFGPGSVEPGCVTSDGDGLYYSSRNVVTALALADGRLRWEEALPGPAGAWKLRREGTALLAWPAEARRTNLHSRWLAAALELTVTFPPEDRPGRGVPVLLLSPQSGRPVQRLNFVPPAPRAHARLAPGEELPALPSLGTERARTDGPVVSLTREGLAVGWEDRTWALRGER